ncbi:uncharacterized protein G2W53_044661 [Senna tora]|uniref:Uncharacterized protein n=1 Tax=Senna tora TaxID=362788 RepID=A0A834W0D6_9FABA|nr:uncharacterized protein G2W53_044661 [Senna tora]
MAVVPPWTSFLRGRGSPQQRRSTSQFLLVPLSFSVVVKFITPKSKGATHICPIFVGFTLLKGKGKKVMKEVGNGVGE